jgi:hypothetical protein
MDAYVISSDNIMFPYTYSSRDNSDVMYVPLFKQETSLFLNQIGM